MALDPAFLDQMVALTGPETGELAKLLSERWGVELPTATAVAVPTTGGAPAADALVTITLKSFPADKKMGVIKAVKDILGLGLMEAKTFTESLPKMVKDNLDRESADKIKKTLTDAGAELEIK